MKKEDRIKIIKEAIKNKEKYEKQYGCLTEDIILLKAELKKLKLKK